MHEIKSHLFRGFIESKNEEIVNSILKAMTVVGINRNTHHAIPVSEIIAIIEQSRLIKN